MADTHHVKDHVVRDVVNRLRDTALEFHAHGSLRERLARELEPLLVASRPAEVDEPQQILNSMTHTARRDHLCAFCGMTVRTGERYVRAQSPGGAQAEKAFHTRCYQGLVTSTKQNNISARKENHDGQT
jgi:hypothetical protein